MKTYNENTAILSNTLDAEARRVAAEVTEAIADITEASGDGLQLDVRTTPEIIQSQIQRESDLLINKIDDFRANLSERKENVTAPGRRLIRLALRGLLTKDSKGDGGYAVDWFAGACAGKSVQHAVAARYLLSLLVEETQDKEQARKDYASALTDAGKANEVADALAPALFLALHTVMGQRDFSNLQSIAREISKAVIADHAARRFREKNPGLAKYLDESQKNVLTNYAKAKVFSSAFSRARVAVQLHRFSETDAEHSRAALDLGLGLLHVVTSSGLFTSELQAEPGSHKTHTALVPSAEASAFLKRSHVEQALTPSQAPMIAPPIPWQYFNGKLVGGAYSMPSHLIRAAESGDYADDILNMLISGDIDQSIAAVNKLQAVGYKINSRVLEVVNICRAHEIGVGKLPKGPGVKPSFSELPDKDDPEFITEKARRNAVLSAWYKSGGDPLTPIGTRLREADSLLNQCSSLKNQQLFFIGNFDFRGRFYYAGGRGINPQGNDLSKGLLQFSEGRAIGAHGLRALKIALANALGADKLSFSERLAIVDKHKNDIDSVALDPLGSCRSLWMDASDPWQALALCFECSEAFAQGESYVSHAIIRVDGTCNGLQHYAALLRDKTTAQAVGMIDSDKPADIYSVVAAGVAAELRKVANGDTSKLKVQTLKGDESLSEEQKTQVASEMLETNIRNAARLSALFAKGLGRKLVKSPVMTEAYGSTYSGKLAQIRDTLTDMHENGKLPPNFLEKAPDGGIWRDVKELSGLLTTLVCQEIARTAGASKVGQEFIAKCAGALTSGGLQMSYVLPDGHPVFCRYSKSIGKRLWVHIGGSKRRLLSVESTRDIDKARTRTASAPNFIHSLDAYHLRRVALACPFDMSVIHDSFGCHAANSEAMAEVIRREFVKMYTDNNFLRILQERVGYMLTRASEDKALDKIPELPEAGDFDINDVLKAAYFFH